MTGIKLERSTCKRYVADLDGAFGVICVSPCDVKDGYCRNVRVAACPRLDQKRKLVSARV